MTEPTKEELRLLEALRRLDALTALSNPDRVAVTIQMIPGYPYSVEIKPWDEEGVGWSDNDLAKCAERALKRHEWRHNSIELHELGGDLPSAKLRLSDVTQQLCSNAPVGISTLRELYDYTNNWRVNHILDVLYSQKWEAAENPSVQTTVFRTYPRTTMLEIIETLTGHEDKDIQLFGQLLLWSARNYDIVTAADAKNLRRAS